HFKMNREENISFYIPVLVKHNVYNTLSSMAIAKHIGVTWEEMKQGIVTIQMTGMRMEIVKKHSGLTSINQAYNARQT
ncbi:UDP-N-acetylmuramoyl-tripeptide--D-alanyl-D-alanine ligase, partial [Bacillus cereus group sp. N18]|nr:UDP-N-acetylmuramoyl-tripeptide--D-alanyl-D-alanine ligase [Bacillus cereus group sp. N18]